MITEEPQTRQKAAAPPVVSRPASCVRCGVKLLLGIFLSLVLLYVARYPLMSFAAKMWIVDDVPGKADAVVVLGGGLDSRPSFAADLYHRGLVPLVLVSDVRDGPATVAGVLPRETTIAISLLEKEGVPASAIQTFGQRVTSTNDESHGVHAWVQEHPLHCLMIPTDPFHTRRVKWLFSRDLKDLKVGVSVPSIPNTRYNPLEWWQSEEATISFQNEIIKLIYYWTHY
jgi:uncharacterized SAM-binding protein YcdF (DUF218 family)